MTDESIIAYLLEELPEDALEQFEDECFAQETWPDQISLVEGDLIEDYLRNELTPERRQRFEQNYLTTEARQERVSIAAALLRHIDECNTVVVPPEELSWAERLRVFWYRQTWGLRAATGIALIAVIAGTLWFLFLRPPSPPTFATLTLSISSNNRGEGAQIGTIKLLSNVDALKISLLLPPQSPPAARYRVAVENIKEEAKPVEIIGQDAQSVLVVIPAAELAQGRYILRLFAIQTDGSEQRIPGSYLFIVE